jgi:hypothetical protein
VEKFHPPGGSIERGAGQGSARNFRFRLTGAGRYPTIRRSPPMPASSLFLGGIPRHARQEYSADIHDIYKFPQGASKIDSSCF